MCSTLSAMRLYRAMSERLPSAVFFIPEDGFIVPGPCFRASSFCHDWKPTLSAYGDGVKGFGSVTPIAIVLLDLASVDPM